MVAQAGPESARDIAVRLQDLVLYSSDVEEFLSELAGLSSSWFSAPGRTVHCGITLLRRKKSATIASSDAQAHELDEIQLAFRDGPCLTAMERMETILVPDLAKEHRWPDYVAAASGHGIRSILAVPLAVEGETKAALNLFASQPHAFSSQDIDDAGSYAENASKTLRLALRIAHLTDARNNLTAAMVSRTTIDVATGIIMAQNRCSQESAFKILRSASNTRNVKLRDVATRIVDSVSEGQPLTTYFDE